MARELREQHRIIGNWSIHKQASRLQDKTEAEADEEDIHSRKDYSESNLPCMLLLEQVFVLMEEDLIELHDASTMKGLGLRATTLPSAFPPAPQSVVDGLIDNAKTQERNGFSARKLHVHKILKKQILEDHAEVEALVQAKREVYQRTKAAKAKNSNNYKSKSKKEKRKERENKSKQDDHTERRGAGKQHRAKRTCAPHTTRNYQHWTNDLNEPHTKKQKLKQQNQEQKQSEQQNKKQMQIPETAEAKHFKKKKLKGMNYPRLSTHGIAETSLPVSKIKSGAYMYARIFPMIPPVSESLSLPSVSKIWDAKKTVSSMVSSREKGRAKCEVFYDLWTKGYCLTPGLQFGGEFLVYRKDPSLIHSEFVVTVWYVILILS